MTKVNNYLITDNYQENRRYKITNRTSSTNIGMSLIAIISAYDMKFISKDETIQKLKNVYETLEKLEKWNGHLYNWYNIKTMEPLRPRFVSTVDSGNFVACLYVVKSFLTEQKACYYFRQLIGVIEYLNTMGISHRDIKPENILLDKNKKNIKVIDFGLSNYCPGKNLLHSSCGSPCYASPEMLSGKPYQGITTDIWSSGIVLYSMLVGSLPFDEQELQKLYEQIKIGKFYLPSTLSLEAIDFMKKILVVDPKKRMGLKEIKNHVWFKMEKNPMYKGINFEDEEFPCDMKTSSYVIKHYFDDDPEVNIDSLVDMVKNNSCNKYTATYYLTKKYILCIEDKYKVIEEENNNEKNKDKDKENIKKEKEKEKEKDKEKEKEKEMGNKDSCTPNEYEKKEIKNKSKMEKKNSKKNSYKNNAKDEDIKIRSKTEENEITKIIDKKGERNEKKKYPSIIISNDNKSKNIEEKNNIVFTENDISKNIKKSKNKENRKKSKQNKKSKESSKIELSNLNLKNFELINNEIKKMNKSKQRLNQEKKMSNINLKSNIIKRKNITTINNLKSLTERIYDYGKKELNMNKINRLIDKNKIMRKKKSPQSSNNFNFYVINNIIHKDKPELINEIFNIKLNHHRKNKSSSIINKKNKIIPPSKTQERINTELGKFSHRNNKLIFINDDIKFEKNNKSKNISNDNSNIVHTKLSSSNIVINNVKNKRNFNNKSPIYFTNNAKNSNNNFNYNKTSVNTNSNININNSDKFMIKNIINIINNSNHEKKRTKMNNLTLCQNLANQSDNNFSNKIRNTKNKQGNSFFGNYGKQKNILNYVISNTSNNLRKSHQRNFSYALRHQLTNFKTDISNKSNMHSISKKKEKFTNDSLMSNPYFPTEKSVNNNKFIKQMKIGYFANNKSHHKNKVI